MESQDRNIDEALDFARKAKEKFPTNPAIMDTLGLVFYKKKLYDSAISEFADCLERLPDNATVNHHLGMAYYKKGNNERAKTQLQKALRLSKKFDGADEARRLLSQL